jgi:uncharacterized protein with von Willebrand factor type A (vWA) domain
VRAALQATLVTSREQVSIFCQAFELFWRDPELHGAAEALSVMLPRAPGPPRQDATLRRLREAWRTHQSPESSLAEPGVPRQRVDAMLTYSFAARLMHKDFEEMTVAELERARAHVARMRLSAVRVLTRRLRADARGDRIDLGRSLRASARAGGHAMMLRWRARVRVRSPLVVLCDISGSMERYVRIVLHFLHALARDRQGLHAFVFGTELTNITRSLRDRDVDRALARVGKNVSDWSGGTRIGPSLRAFNRDWSRRVLGQGAIVLLITDGLDRGPAGALGAEVARLQRSCRRLVWLNPLLRFEGFEPRARGVAQLLAHVDEHRPVHNLASLGQLASALTRMSP